RRTCARFLKSPGSIRFSLFSLTWTRHWPRPETARGGASAPRHRGTKTDPTLGSVTCQNCQRLTDIRGNVESRGQLEVAAACFLAKIGIRPNQKCVANRIDVARIVEDGPVNVGRDNFGEAICARGHDR